MSRTQVREPDSPVVDARYGKWVYAVVLVPPILIIACLAQRLDIIPTATDIPPPNGLVVNRPTGGAPMLVSAR